MCNQPQRHRVFFYGTRERFFPPDERWLARGWSVVPKHEEADIKRRWTDKFECNGEGISVPAPSKTFDGLPIRRVAQPRRSQIEAELTTVVINGFRAITPVGRRILYIDWLHGWYYFDPHAEIQQETDDSWPLPILPDNDFRHILSFDFQCGLISSPVAKITIFGERLLAHCNCSLPPELPVVA